MALAAKVTLKEAYWENGHKNTDSYAFLPVASSSFSIYPSFRQISQGVGVEPGQGTHIGRFRISVHCQFADLGARLEKTSHDSDSESDSESDSGESTQEKTWT